MARRARVKKALGAITICACGLAWSWLRDVPPKPLAVHAPAHREPRATPPVAASSERAPSPLARAPAPAEAAAATPLAAGEDDEALHRAHPITPEHEALRAELQVLGALNDALDLRDARALRTLVARYDALAPEDPLRLGEGYERVADCLEARAPAQRATARGNAQRYYDDARGSTLRRYVRRLCLEPGSDAR